MTAGRHRPVLVVDDDAAIRAVVVEVLADEGYDTVTAADGAQALAVLEEHAPSLILLDMKMPGMDGWAFAAAYRARPGPRAPVVVCTAAADSGRRAAEIEADGFLAKPFALEDLLSVVARYALPGRAAGAAAFTPTR